MLPDQLYSCPQGRPKDLPRVGLSLIQWFGMFLAFYGIALQGLFREIEDVCASMGRL